MAMIDTPLKMAPDLPSGHSDLGCQRAQCRRFLPSGDEHDEHEKHLEGCGFLP